MAHHVFLLTYHESTYPSVAPLALDVLSMPASEAYVNVCSVSKNMERWVFLKMNSKIPQELVINAVFAICRQSVYSVTVTIRQWILDNGYMV